MDGVPRVDVGLFVDIHGYVARGIAHTLRLWRITGLAALAQIILA